MSRGHDHYPEKVIGITNAYGSEGPCLRLLTLNVTVLTMSRLYAVLGKAAEEHAGVVNLQETKHPRHGFRWATKILTEAGWKIQWSDPPGSTATVGRRAAGGTAILWRRELGRGDAIKSLASSVSQHRSGGGAWGALQIWSANGDPNRPDLQWFGALLASAQNSIAQQHAAVLIGGFNWKPAYDKSLCCCSQNQICQIWHGCAHTMHLQRCHSGFRSFPRHSWSAASFGDGVCY